MENESFHDFQLQLGCRIKEIRVERGLLQEDVAAGLGISRVAVGYIEQGRRSPKLHTLYQLARIFEIEIKDFFEYDPPPEKIAL